MGILGNGEMSLLGGGGRAVREPPLREETGGRVLTRLFGLAASESHGGMGKGDGSPHARGQREGERWIPASVFTRAGYSWEDRDGSPPPAFAGAGSRREDNGGEALTFPRQGERDL